MFSNKDLEQIAAQGSSVDIVNQQIAYFKSGFPFMKLAAAATPGNGILQLAEAELSSYQRLFEEKSKQLSLLKFVPASGAASRMFKSLFAALDEGKADQSVEHFFEHLGDFAFAQELLLHSKNGERVEILEGLLTEAGLGYGNLPKGLLSFHKYPDGSIRTPAEEHLVEGVNYSKSGNIVKIHFTVSPEHLPKFQALFAEKQAHYEQVFGVQFDISFSIQKPATDTIAVNMDNTPFREPDGSLLFRPAGHGALLANLNDISADIIFIKNIDNVVPDRLKADTYTYKKALAGVLISLQTNIFAYLDLLKSGSPTLSELDEIALFMQKQLGSKIASGFYDLSHEEQCQYLFNQLNRPLRVCGMVKNQGEPGGGPFWCEAEQGKLSLQIVESAQVDFANEAQKEIFAQSTHFNPVDLVVAPMKYDGSKFDLSLYTDPQTGFITEKSKDGKSLKAQELPGLWNGSMAQWNTVFVEVPLITFNPVKTVNDLLREEHR